MSHPSPAAAPPSKRRRVEPLNNSDFVSSSNIGSRSGGGPGSRGGAGGKSANANASATHVGGGATGSKSLKDDASHNAPWASSASGSVQCPISQLPDVALQRYCLHYDLFPQPHPDVAPLSYHSACRPTPPLPAVLPDLTSKRAMTTARGMFRRSSTTSGGFGSGFGGAGGHHRKPPKLRQTMNSSLTAGTIDHSTLISGSVDLHRRQSSSSSSHPLHAFEQQHIHHPQHDDHIAPQFAGLSALDDPSVVKERLVETVKAHWDRTQFVKEGETITNFMLAVRLRDRVLKEIPYA